MSPDVSSTTVGTALRPDEADARARRRAVWTMVAAALLWSIAGLFTRFLERAEGFEVTFWRSLSCAVFVLVALVWRYRSGWWRPIARAGLAGVASGVMWSIMFCCFMIALTMTTVANVLTVSALAPLLAALLAWVVLGERIRGRTWLAIGAAIVGIWWMAHGGLSTGGLAGMAVALGVPLASACNIVLLKRHGDRVNLIPAVLFGALISCAFTLPLAWPLQASPRDIINLGFLGVFQLGLPCMMMVRAARRLAPQQIALLALLEVVFGPLWVWLSLLLFDIGEQPTAATLQGSAVVLAALVFNEVGMPGRSRRVGASLRAP